MSFNARSLSSALMPQDATDIAWDRSVDSDVFDPALTFAPQQRPKPTGNPSCRDPVPVE